LPRRVVFVGGGYISFEFGHVAARAGARVTILHRGAHPLGSFDPDLVDLLVSRTERLGITLRLQTEVTGIEPAQPGFRVHLSGGGQRDAVDADLVVHGAGRTADLRDLTLTAAGVDWSSRGVAVNDYLQSVSNPAVYAAGDAAATDAPKLTPVAAHHGRVVSSNLLEGNHRKPDHSVVPSVVFTVPALASVGLHERTVRDRDLHFTVHREDTHAWYSSRRVGETASGFKVLVEEGSGRILGAHLLGPSADEVINLFAMAMRAGMPASAIKEILYAYPTGGSDVSHMV